MRARHKSWTRPYLSAHPEVALPSLSSDTSFFEGAPLALEIGCGKGDFVLQMSRLFPEVHFLAMDKVADVLAVALKKGIEAEAKNIRYLNQDFDEAYEELSQYHYQRIYLNFSDPWPKKRHEKRRLTERGRLLRIASLLTEDGEIRFKSDQRPLYEFTLREAEADQLKIVSQSEDYALAPDDCMSEYEASFRKEGKPIYRIILKKGD